MPDTIAASSQNILPLWDSFEATFFVVAGLSVGFVLGYLFPSIWRTLRRRFRPRKRFLVSEISWERSLDLSLKLLDSNTEEKQHYSIIEMFVIARDFVQKRELRYAIKMYGEILTSVQVTTPHIHKAMFELAQVYFLLKLYSRAFDTGFELLKRKSRDVTILKFTLDVLEKHFDENKLDQVFKVYKGTLNELIKNQMSFLAASYAQKYLRQDQNISKAISLSKLALKIHPDASFAQMILWQAFSLKTRQKNALSVSSRWIALAGDLSAWISICRVNHISVSAATPYLSQLLLSLYRDDSGLESFSVIKNEFYESLKFLQMSIEQKKILMHILVEIFYESISALNEKKHLTYHDFVGSLFKDDISFYRTFSLFFVFSKENIFVNDILNTDVIRVGLTSHKCKNCKTLYAGFQWSCKACGSYESLESYLSPFAENAFYEQNWRPDKDNRNRCAHPHSYS